MKSTHLFFAIAYFSFLLVGYAQPKKTDKAVSVKILIDSLDRALYRNYIFPEKSAVIIKYVNEQLRTGAYKNISEPVQLAERLSKDIQLAHKDPHLRINYDPGFAEVLSKPAPPPSPGSDSIWIGKAKKDNFSFKKVEVLNGNIGYVKFDGFNGFIKDAKEIATSAFKFVSNTDAVIMDLRNNGGGSPWMVKQIASYFVTERTRLNDIYERKSNETFEFWAEPELGENLRLSMPLYILTSNGTASAAEDFTYAMKINKRAVIVGDTTVGGAHPTGPVAIGQGFIASIPFARSRNHITKTDWEGTGVIPDVPVKSEDALTKAQTLILEKLIEKASLPEEKRRLTWALKAMYVTDYGLEASFEGYEGMFRDYSILLKENKLYFRDPWGDHLLRPISGQRFSAGDWIHIEFILDSAAKNTAIKILNRDGGEEIISRNK